MSLFFFTPPPEHTRDYPYRPPLHVPKNQANDWPLYRRFISIYVLPKWKTLLAAMILLALTSTSSYLMSFLVRYVVDDVLVVKVEEGKGKAGGQNLQRGRHLSPAHRSQGRPSSRPEVSSNREMGRPSSRPDTGTGKSWDFGKLTFGGRAGAGRLLAMIALLFMTLDFLLNFSSRLSTRKQIVVSQEITSKLRENMHEKVMALSMSYHQSMSPGRLLSRILSDVDSVRIEMMALFRSSTHCISMIIVGGCILLWQDWRVALMAFAITPIYAALYKSRRPFIRHLNQEMRHTNAMLYGLVSQKIDGMKAIQSYAREREEQLAFHRLISCSIRDTLMCQRLSSVLNSHAIILTGAASAAIFLFCGMQVLKGQMSLGKMLFLHNVTMQLFDPVLEFAQLPFILQRLRISLMRVNGVLTRPVEIADPPGAVSFPAPMRQGVFVQNLFFTYPDSGSVQREVEDEALSPRKPPEPVLRGVSFTVPAGEWLCIMGSSGSGKTTLLKLLAHLYEPTFGQILYDGVDLKNIRLLSLRKEVGMVPQEAQIFSGSVRDNICYARPDATNKQIREAAQAAQLHDFIMSMKVQYETLIGQKGASLSGGQRQRLSLARALLTDPSLLLLDDCTSALDADTERKIQETLARVLQGRTAIMVSQRVTMAMRCHKIAVLSNGIISEYGTHAELLAKGGFYATLFKEQTM